MTFTGLTSLLPWGMISGAGEEANKPRCAVVEGGVEEERTTLLLPKTSGTVTREAQLGRLRRELEVAGRPVVGVNSSSPCCSRCKTDSYVLLFLHVTHRTTLRRIIFIPLLHSHVSFGVIAFKQESAICEKLAY
ncbi:hypothetical protein AG1IA_00478 [Rhizoctonia solani AG-1 IA]|uniref:Secreted protein n=1 Tax=Thanatephorus cucumeris (strain AG1-IA) TaxID=983506 RepID=L8X9Y1_THACA|nr:hypothetical protein AG1IA_00478 [Rhizoctonia solani AG-1 IA]